MKRYIPNELSQQGEWRDVDTGRARAIHKVLEVAGLNLWRGEQYGDGARPQAHVTVQPSTAYYAVEIRVWALAGDSMAERDASHDQAVAALRAAGYFVNEASGPRFSPYLEAGDDWRTAILAYLPEWGGQLPEETYTASEVAAYLGISPSTLRAYVSRGQAPAPDDDRYAPMSLWYVSTIDRWRATRPGKPGRPANTTSK